MLAALSYYVRDPRVMQGRCNFQRVACARVSRVDAPARDLHLLCDANTDPLEAVGGGLLSKVAWFSDTTLSLGIRLTYCGEGTPKPATA